MKGIEFIRNVNDPEKERQILQKYWEILERNTTNLKSNNLKLTAKDTWQSDVTSMLYLPDENMLIVGTSNSMIKFYDESSEEDQDMLKYFLGGHQGS